VWPARQEAVGAGRVMAAAAKEAKEEEKVVEEETEVERLKY
jgi:hypothetical protein